MVAVLMSTGLTAFAATTTPVQPSKLESVERGNRGPRPGRPDRPELTEEQKAQMADQMKVRLGELLENGTITQEQYDQAIADIADGKRPGLRGLGRTEDGACDMERPDRSDRPGHKNNRRTLNE